MVIPEVPVFLLDLVASAVGSSFWSSSPTRGFCIHYPLVTTPTTSESSPYDLSSERSLDSSSPSTGPSRKRCRSSTTLVPSSNLVSRSITYALADLSPRKRFRDSYSSEVSREEHIEMGIADVETVVNLGILCEAELELPYWRMVLEFGFCEVATSDIREDEEEFEAEASEGGMMEIAVGGLGQLVVSRERVGLADRVGVLGQDDNLRVGLVVYRRIVMILGGDLGGWSHLLRDNMTITRSGMTLEAIEELVNRRVEEALAAYEVTRAANALEAESQIQNGSDDDNRNGGNGNRGNGNGGNGNPNEDMEINFPEKYQVKYATCTLLNNALTWWNSHKRTVGTDVAVAMSWRKLMNLVAEVFQELTMLCTKMVPKEEDRVERFIGGLPDNI
ncbi:hypothetical protein Tco_1576057 [Tanacetum coccineum]